MRGKHAASWFRYQTLALAGGLALALPFAGCGDDDEAQVTCGGGTRLEGDTCMPVEGLTCGDGTHLDGESCAPDVTCGDGTEEVDGACEPTEGLTCGSGTERIEDECLPTEGLTCGDGTVEEDGECLPESLLECGEGTHAEGGSCLPDSTLACGPETHEEANQCLPDPETLASQWGIFTVEEYDSSGDDLLPDTTDHTYIYVNSGISFAATATKNGVHVFDYDAVQDCIEDAQGCPADNEFLPIASVEVDTPIAEGAASTNWSSHALGVSPDGQWIYQAFLVPYTRYSFRDYSARFPNPATWFYKINARTLLPDKKIDCGGPQHHINIVNDRYMMTECYSEAGVFFWDPANDDEVVSVYPYGRFEGYPYLAFESPPLEFRDEADPPRFLAVTVSSHNNTVKNAAGETEEVPGYIALINENTGKEEAAPPIGPFGIWARWSSDGTRLWATSADDDMVRRYDLSLNAQTNLLQATLAAEIEVGPGPYGLELNADETLLYVDDKAEGVRAGQTTVHGSTVTVVDADAASDTYDTVVFTIGLSMDAATEPHRPDHMYRGPDERMWQCSNANQSCQVMDPDVTPDTGGIMTECTRIRTAHEFPACASDGDCPLGLACDVNGKCGGTSAILETIECMEAPILATLRLPDAGEVPGWTVGRGDPHSVVWVRYDAQGDARVIQDFVSH